MTHEGVSLNHISFVIIKNSAALIKKHCIGKNKATLLPLVPATLGSYKLVLHACASKWI